MSIQKTILALSVAGLLVAGAVWAAPVSGPTFTLYTVHGFVEMLIERGIISPGFADKARSYANIFSRVDDAEEKAEQSMQNADKVSVSLSQLIQYSKLEFAEGSDVEGMLLMVTNETDAPITLEAKRGCQVLYRIYDGDTMLFDSATQEKCKTDERVTYVLEGRKTRMFEIIHRASDYALPVGTYRVELEYPGYGEGERTVTILNP